MTFAKYFISCDWGTSNFRLRLVDSLSAQILVEHQTNQGIKTLYERYLNQKEFSQIHFFANYLKGQIELFPSEHQQHLIILSGMASANIGLMELEYANLPFASNGNNLFWKHIQLPNGLNTILISGVKSEQSIMRGEEIQAVGLESELQSFETGILILPGTHSKHIDYNQGVFTDFKTFMTGELFELLAKKSILRNSVSQSTWSQEREAAFRVGILLGSKGEASESLFSIRAMDLLSQRSKEDNYYFLSGLLIGAELSYLQEEKRVVFLAASGIMLKLYQFALELICHTQQLIIIDEKVLNQALIIGHKKIFLQYGK